MDEKNSKKQFDDALKKLSEDLVALPYRNCETESDEDANKDKKLESDLKVSSSYKLTEAEVRYLLEHKVFFTKKSKKLQNKIQILNISSTNVYMYFLETYVEKRERFWQFKKYICGGVENQSNTALDSWNVNPEKKMKPFENEIHEVIVPNSEKIQPCFNCFNKSQITDCPYCIGNGWLIFYQKIRIIRHSYRDHFVTEPHLLPLGVLKQASPQLMFKETKNRVEQFNCVEKREITKESGNLINLHKKKSKKEKILLQRHEFRKVQITSVDFVYNRKFKRVFIYGGEKSKEVHVPGIKVPSYCFLL